MVLAQIGLSILGVLILFIASGIHRVEEGHIGVYFRGGAILPGTTNPGFHFMYGLVTEVYNV